MVLWGGGNTQWVVCLSVSVCAPEWKAETQIAELICHRQTWVWGDTRLIWDPPNWLSWSLPSLVMWRLCNVVQPAAGVEISHPTHKPSFLFPDKSFLVTTAILLTWPKEHPVSWIHYLQQFSIFFQHIHEHEHSLSLWVHFLHVTAEAWNCTNNWLCTFHILSFLLWACGATGETIAAPLQSSLR